MAVASQIPQPALSLSHLANAWLATHGLTGLLAASARWHKLRPQITTVASQRVLPALLGEWEQAGHLARELLTIKALVEEGEAMHHCVGDYWDDCVDGDRIFRLLFACGERATAQYVPQYKGKDDMQYTLKQLRGPTNTEASSAMVAFAEEIALAINAVERRDARLAVLDAVRSQEHGRQIPLRPAAWFDTLSEQQLRQTLAWIEQSPAGSEVLLIADIAGYGYHAGPALEGDFAPGQALALVREPDNPYDPLAVRLDWHGHKIGYVPRPDNAAVAHAIDDDLTLAARIVELAGCFGDPWHRVTFAIETTPACSTLTA